MTEFFAQLGARYRGEAEVLQPRVPFRFEPVRTSLAAADPIEQTAAESWRPAPEAHREPRGSAARPAGADAPDESRRGPSVRHPARGMDDVRPMHGLVVAAGPDPGRPGTAAAGALRPPRDQPAAAARERPPAELTERVAPAGAAEAGQATAAISPRARQPEREPEPEPEARQAEPGTRQPETRTRRREPGAARDAQAATSASERAAPRAGRRSGRAAGVQEAAAELEADAEPGANGSRRLPLTALAPMLPGDGGRQVAVAAPSLARRIAGDRRTQGRMAGEAPGGEENITVQVTIGRVEVRAAQPATPERSASSAAAGPNLADYLRRRSRSAGAPP